MASDRAVRLRDQRKPGHGWFDNEIYDVFGDELQQNGISVYMTLARLCYGVSVTMSLREMSGHARMSKDTFSRSLKRVVAIGLVIEHKGATAQSASTYELVDVKELALQFMRSTMEANRIKEAARRQTVSVRDSAKSMTLVDLIKNRAVNDVSEAITEDDANCLMERQSGKDAIGEDKKICAGESATEVSQTEGRFETEVSQDVRHLRQDTKHKIQDKSPQPPSQATGASGDSAEAVAKVMRECNLSARRMAAVILAAMRLERSKSDDPPAWNSIAERMIARQRSYVDYSGRGYLRFGVGMRKFFAEGLWVDDELWAIDWRKLREESRARVGT